MKIATKDLKDEALLWAAVSVVWPNDSCVMKPYSCSKASLIDMYGNGDITERAIEHYHIQPCYMGKDKWAAHWIISASGSTARIALLSALVQAKLGEFVDVPDHLV